MDLLFWHLIQFLALFYEEIMKKIIEFSLKYIFQHKRNSKNGDFLLQKELPLILLWGSFNNYVDKKVWVLRWSVKSLRGADRFSANGSEMSSFVYKG